ncbi:hypothetical protein ASD76_06990 [Altererythrobacter sp. Root672]|nr:hypothetical protein ASD76_06990 [Altererythrobacter sp. Root672]
MDFGDPEVLRRLAASGSTGYLIEVLALVAPALGLGAGIGWLHVAGKDRGEAQMGVLLWYIGTLFIVLQDALEVAAFQTLPAAYLAADAASVPAILANGDLAGNIIAILTVVGTIIGDLGILLIAAALMARKDKVSLFAWVGFAAVAGRVLGLLVPALAPLRMLGFLMLLVWVIGLGLLMLRKGDGAAPAASRT